MPARADRNLLFGILALQMDFITRDQLVAAMNAWVLDKIKPLGVILVQQGAMQTDDVNLLEPLVARHIQQHGNDPQKSLAAASSLSNIEEQLKAVPDADVQASLEFFGAGYDKTRTHAPSPGDHRDEVRYRILRPHARGGLGEVFVAKDTELNREVALKEIQPGKDRRDSRSRFVFEAEVTGGLEHPGIVPVYGLGHYADGRPYYAMRFIKGDNLSEAIKRFHGLVSVDASARHGVETQSSDHVGLTARRSPDFDSLDFRRLLQRFIDVCNAIGYAHSRGVLHRDLKPGNIMLGKYGETLVVDWGLAKTQKSPELERSAHVGEVTLIPSSGSDIVPTQHGSTIGTPAYMSPEQAEGKLDELGPASDVYSLGATLYHLLVGKPANADRDIVEILICCKKGDIPPPRAINPAIPQALSAICLKAMAHNPTDRYSSAQVLAAEIENWLADEPVGAFPEPISIRTRRWMRKHPGPVAGVAATLLVGIAGSLIGLAAVERQRQRTVAQEKQTALALEQVSVAKKLADNRFDLALNAFNEMVFDLQSFLQKRSGTVEVRRELLAKARPGLEKLLAEAEAAHGADRTLVWSYFQFGDVALDLGDTSVAQTEYQKGHDIALKLAAADPKNAQAQRDLAVSLGLLGMVTKRSGNVPRALDYYRKSLEISERLVAADPKNAEAQHDLAVAFEKLGEATQELGNTTDALDYFRKGLDVRERRAAADPEYPLAQRDLAHSFDNLGDVTQQLGNAKEALDYYLESLKIRERLAAADPKNDQSNATCHSRSVGWVTLRGKWATQRKRSTIIAGIWRLANEGPPPTRRTPKRNETFRFHSTTSVA